MVAGDSHQAILCVVLKKNGRRGRGDVIILDYSEYSCSPEQNAWNTFHVFRNRNSDSIGRTLGVIPFILIPE